jgi:uncharacterized DUF497 family protein
MHIKYCWDAVKAKANVEKHGVEFADAWESLMIPTPS